MQLDGRVKYGGLAPPKALSFATNLVIVMWRMWGRIKQTFNLTVELVRCLLIGRR